MNKETKNDGLAAGIGSAFGSALGTALAVISGNWWLLPVLSGTFAGIGVGIGRLVRKRSARSQAESL